MKLPNARRAMVERGKIVDYLLNESHPRNRGKCAYFQSRGFSVKSWRFMAAAFQELARSGNVLESMETPHGMKYIVEGDLKSPSGKPMLVQSVWVVNPRSNVPRFITAVPHLEQPYD
ncbi:MAG TPA: hypothetical protein VKX17_02445 [Planctomycetota bacterium]|nr:hypothetical protein [Planctomycetota bacterium]